jgi:hypothetical protein
VLAAVMALGVTYVLLRSVGGAGPSDRPAEPPRVAPPVTVLAEPLASPTPPLRNVFEYYSEPALAPAAPIAPLTRAPVAPEPAAAPEPPPAVRLIGLLHRGGQVKAALAILGTTVVLATGEAAAGYTVISIDEEDGVRLRGPDGSVVFVRVGSSAE